MAKRYKGLEYVSENENFILTESDGPNGSKNYELHTDVETLSTARLKELNGLINEVLIDNGDIDAISAKAEKVMSKFVDDPEGVELVTRPAWKPPTWIE